MNRSVLVVGLALVVPTLLLFTMGFVNAAKPAPKAPLVGIEAPAFSLTPSGGGAEVSLASLKGKPIVINFWATWCEPCQAEHATLHRAAEILGDRVQFLGVAFDEDPSVVDAWLKKRGSRYPTLVDPGARTTIAYGVAGVPETFFIDADGRIVSKFSGAIDPATLVARTTELFAKETP